MGEHPLTFTETHIRQALIVSAFWLMLEAAKGLSCRVSQFSQPHSRLASFVDAHARTCIMAKA